MKYSVSLFVLVALFAFNVQAQKINKVTTKPKQPPRICGMTIAGVSSLVAGTGMGVGALLLDIEAGAR